MNWIKDRLDQRQAKKTNINLIAQHSEQIYNDLWREITNWVDEAKSQGIAVSTNGNTYDRVVMLDQDGRHTELRIKLVKEKESSTITVQNGHGLYSISIAVCPDGVVCLRLDGERLSMKKAAVHILDPFLFPDCVASQNAEKGDIATSLI